MKVVFLDFDGVITTLKSKWRLDPEKMELVKRILDETGAKIVISSSWRLSTLEDTLKDLSYPSKNPWVKSPFILAEYVVGVTELFSGRSHRGEEIDDYLNSHPEVTNYVILDDDRDMLEKQQDRFVHTDTYLGINEEDVTKAISILKQ